MTDPLEVAAARAHKAIDQILEDKKDWNGPCHKCRFLLVDSLFGYQYCRHPVVAPPVWNPIKGEVGQPSVKTKDARAGAVVFAAQCEAGQGLCGPRGRLFSPRPSLGSRFFSWLFGELK